MKPFYTYNDLLPHDPFSLVKCCETLAFLVRDVAHITPFNFKHCVHAMRTFVEAALYASEWNTHVKITIRNCLFTEFPCYCEIGERKEKSKISNKHSKSYSKHKKVPTSKKSKFTSLKSQNNSYDAEESDLEECPDSYFQVPLQVCNDTSKNVKWKFLRTDTYFIKISVIGLDAYVAYKNRSNT